MKTIIKYGSYITGYTLFYHALYYCPPISGGFLEVIKAAHSIFIFKKDSFEKN